MKRIGRIGKLNIIANKRLKKEYERRQITRCEICGNDFGLSWHHKKKRLYYYTHEGLGEFSETLLLCQSCHDKLESDNKLSDYYFKKLRYENNKI